MSQTDVIVTYKLNDEISSNLNRIDNKTKDIEKTTKKVENNFNNTGKSVKKLGSNLISFGAMLGVGLGVREIIQTTSEFQKYQTVLNNMFGDRQGEAYFQNLKKMAETLPASLGEVTNSFVKLNGIGVNATNDELTALSDLAAAAGKNVLDASEAMVGAVTGEFERLKGLNIVTRVNGNKVTFMYKNQKTTVDNTTESIRKYLVGLGKMQGVAGASNKIMNTMGGVVSNIGDSFSSIGFTLGKALLPLFKRLATMVSWLANKLPGLIRWFEKWGFVIKSLVAALAGFFIITKVITLVPKVITLVKGLTVAFKALTLTMNINPFVAIATAIIGIGVAMYELQKRFGGFSNLWDKLWENITLGWSEKKAAISLLFNYISGNIDLLMLKVDSMFYEITGRIGKLMQASSEAMSGDFTKSMETLKSPFHNVMKDVYDGASKQFDRQIAIQSAKLLILHKRVQISNLKMNGIWNGTIDPMTGKRIVQDNSDAMQQVDSANSAVAAGLAELTANQNVKYITVNVNKMIESFNINTTNLTNATGQIREEIILTLQKVIADASSINN